MIDYSEIDITKLDDSQKIDLILKGQIEFSSRLEVIEEQLEDLVEKFQNLDLIERSQAGYYDS